jgi:hypothetical protein
MSDLRTAAQQALEALEYYEKAGKFLDVCRPAIRTLRAALAQEQPDTDCHAQGICQRSGYSIGERKQLTEDEIERLIQTYSGYCRDDFASVARAIERAHGIKGGDHE